MGGRDLRRLVRISVQRLEELENKDIEGSNFQKSNLAVLGLLTDTMRNLTPLQKRNLARSLQRVFQSEKRLTEKGIVGLLAAIAFWTFYVTNYAVTDPHIDLSRSARRIVRKDSQMERDMFFDAFDDWQD